MRKSVFLALISFDLMVLILHLLLGSTWPIFHLDFEKNFPTIYQSAKLILFGLFFLWSVAKKKYTFEALSFIVPMGIFLLGLGLDELLQIHENIYRFFELFDWLHPSKIVTISYSMGYRSSLWILYYLPIIFLFVFWFGYWFRFFQARIRSNLNLILLGTVSFFIVILTEVLSSTGSYTQTIYFGLITIEETAEMLLASSLIVVGLRMLNKQSYNPVIKTTNSISK